MVFNIGDRVVTPRGEVGYLEEADNGMVKVRIQTPDDNPSCCSSWCLENELSDGTNILPQPRSKAWRRESMLFCMGVKSALTGLDDDHDA